MKLTKVSGVCGRDDCPTVYATDHGSVVVQGLLITDAENVAPALDEALVEIPCSILLEAASVIGR